VWTANRHENTHEGSDEEMKKLTLAVMLALVALMSAGVALADTESGSGIVGTQSP